MLIGAFSIPSLKFETLSGNPFTECNTFCCLFYSFIPFTSIFNFKSTVDDYLHLLVI